MGIEVGGLFVTLSVWGCGLFEGFTGASHLSEYRLSGIHRIWYHSNSVGGSVLTYKTHLKCQKCEDENEFWARTKSIWEFRFLCLCLFGSDHNSWTSFRPIIDHLIWLDYELFSEWESCYYFFHSSFFMLFHFLAFKLSDFHFNPDMRYQFSILTVPWKVCL